MIFVDTGTWFAAFVPDDPDHGTADPWLEAHCDPLVPTDSVHDDLLTLLKRRGEYQRALQVSASLCAENMSPVHILPDGAAAGEEART